MQLSDKLEKFFFQSEAGIPLWYKLLFFFEIFLIFCTPFIYTNDLMYPHVHPQVYWIRLISYTFLPVYVFGLLSFKAMRIDMKSFVNQAVFIFFGIFTVASIFALDSNRAFFSDFIRMGGMFTQYAYLLVFLYTASFIKAFGKTAKDIFITFFLSMAVYVSFYAIIVKFFFDVEAHGKQGLFGIIEQFAPSRVSGVFGNPVYLGSFAILPIGLALYLFFSTKKQWVKIASFVIIFLQLMTIIAAQARGAMMGLIAGCVVAVFLVMFLTKKSIVRAWGLVGLGLLTIIIVAFYTLPNFGNNIAFLQRFKVTKDGNTSIRLELWRMAYKGFLDKPVLGYGVENFNTGYHKYFREEMYDRDLLERQDKPHNHHLEMAYSGGVFGFGAYAFFVLSVFYALYQMYKREELTLGQFAALFSAYFGYLLQLSFFFETSSPTIYYYLFIPIALGGYFKTKDIKKDNNLTTGINASIAGFVAIFAIFIIIISVYNPYSASVGQIGTYSRLNKNFSLEGLQDFLNWSKDERNTDKIGSAVRLLEMVFQIKEFTKNGKVPLTMLKSAEEYAIQGFKNADIKNIPNPEMHNFHTQLHIMYHNDFNVPLDPELKEKVDYMVTSAPSKADFRQTASDYYRLVGDGDKALEHALKAYDLQPKSPRSAWVLSQSYAKAGKFQEAVDYFRIALTSGGSIDFQIVARDVMWVATALDAKGEADTAIHFLKTGVQYTPLYEPAYILLRDIYTKHNKTDALKDLRTQYKVVFNKDL